MGGYAVVKPAPTARLTVQIDLPANVDLRALLQAIEAVLTRFGCAIQSWSSTSLSRKEGGP